MQNLRNKLMAGGAVMILAAIGTMMNRQAMQAAGGPSVTIESPIPLPVTGTVAVTGSTTVSGTVAATQSGTWNVGLTGTPNVNVANPATAPALFLNVNDPGRIAYQSLNTNPSCSVGQCLAFFPAVPSQHRLVVQHFSSLANFSAAPSFVNASLNEQSGFFLSIILAPVIGSASRFDQPVLVYYDAGQQPFAELQAVGATVTAATITLTGYMLDCTIAPCAAIAQ